MPGRVQRLGRAGGRSRPGAQAQGRPSVRRGSSLLGGYLGSYTGVLLACTAVPVWSRSRALLGPIFVATATATGAAATRLTLAARGLPADHPTGTALATIETAAMLTELSLSSLGERRLGDAAEALRRGRPGTLYRTAKGLVVLGLSQRVLVRSRGRADDLASVLYLVAGLMFRFAWVFAGRASAGDDAVVAAGARRRPARAGSIRRSPLPLPDAARRAYGETCEAREPRGRTAGAAARPLAQRRGLRRERGAVCVQYERKIDHARSALRLPQGDLARGGSRRRRSASPPGPRAGRASRWRRAAAPGQSSR